MFRLISALLIGLLALPAHAACTGTDLLVQLPSEQRQDLYDRAESVPYPNGLLWRAERGDEVVHLMGTLHTADARHQDNMARITPLIDEAKVILLEMGDGDQQRLQNAMARDPSLAFIVEGPTLPDLLSAEDWDQLRVAMADRGVPGFMAAKMKPWFAMLTLGMSACVFQETLAGKTGLDQMIIDHANSIENPAIALEDFDTSMRLFSDYEEAELLEMLRLTLALEDVDPASQYSTLVEAYFRQEVRVIWEFGILQTLANPQGMSEAQVMEEYARLENTLINQRNIAWIDPILAATKIGDVFVAAGALHLPGEFGVLNLLEEKGFTLTQLPLP